MDIKRIAQSYVKQYGSVADATEMLHRKLRGDEQHVKMLGDAVESMEKSDQARVAKGKKPTSVRMIANQKLAVQQAEENVKTTKALLKLLESGDNILESALSFSEKRTLQKTVADGMAALKGGKVSFTEKRALQKQVQEALAKLNAKVEEQKYYHLQTRNWNQSAEAKALLDDTLQYGVIRYQNAADDNDDKYVLDTTDKALADKVDGLFKAAQSLSGGDATYDVLDKPYGDMGGEGDTGKPQNQNLLDLQSGKFDSLDPLAFLGKLKEIADEINDIEPLKGPAIAYIEKNSERVSAVMESAMHEAFGKLWGATA